MNDSQQVVKARKDWVALQRLLACMRDTEDLNNDLLANQSWQSLLFRAELAQQLWKDINNSQEYHSFLLSHEQESPYKSTSQQVDYLCRRAHDLARRLKEEEDEQESKQDIIHQLFFSQSSETVTVESQDSSDDSAFHDEQVNDEEHENNLDTDDVATGMGSKSQEPTSYQELQQEQRKQMEEAISQMAAHMKEATRGLNATLQQQTLSTLNTLETVAEQNVQEVSQVANNVKDHNQRQWKKNLSTWTMVFTIVGIFCFSLLTIFTIPKDPNATCMLFSTCETNISVESKVTKPGILKRFLQTITGVEDDNVNKADNQKWSEMFQESNEELEKRRRLEAFMANQQRPQRQQQQQQEYQQNKQKDRVVAQDTETKEKVQDSIQKTASPSDPRDIDMDQLLASLSREQQKVDEEAKKAEEARLKAAEQEAKMKAEEEARRITEAEAEARRKAEEARLRAKQAEEARLKAAEQEAKMKAEEEARRIAEAEARRKAEEAAREMRAVQEEEARIKAKEIARAKAEEEAAKLKAEAAAKEVANQIEKELLQAKELRRRAEEEVMEAKEREEGVIINSGDFDQYVENGRRRLDSHLQNHNLKVTIETEASSLRERDYYEEEEEESDMEGYVQAGRSRLEAYLQQEGREASNDEL